jgi:hypothetical protein
VTIKSYSNKSNALRALKTTHPELVGSLTNAELAERYLQDVSPEDAAGKVLKGQWMIVIPTDVKVVKRHIYKGVQFRRRSVEPEGITKAVHDMFSEYQAEAEEKDQTLTRKQYIARAVRDGVAYYTARTQYQKWSRG